VRRSSGSSGLDVSVNFTVDGRRPACGLPWPLTRTGLARRAAPAAFLTDVQHGAQEPAPGLPKVLVFGGNGFVGSRVCEEALRTGLGVVSVNRSGAPRHRAPWVDEVTWLQARARRALPRSVAMSRTGP